MAISQLLSGLEDFAAHSGLVTILSVLLGIAAAYLYLRPTLVPPKGSPPLIKEDWPIIGTLRFFNRRWDFFKEAMNVSSSGAFSFHVGSKHVIGLHGVEGRKSFFDSKTLNFSGGYLALFAGGPDAPKDEDAGNDPADDDVEFIDFFNKRIQQSLKGDILRRNLPKLMADTRKSFELLAADPQGTTNPFDSIYKIVYQLTMRTVACNDIANDPALLEKTLYLYEEVEHAATPTVVMFPSLPTPAKLRRMWGGAKLYMTFKKIVDERNKTGFRDEDALQSMIDQGDDIRSIITFVLGALFAGQLNSGINAAWVLIYLAQDHEWQQRARAEVEAVANKYNPDTSLPLPERLACVPAEAWETEFKILELCLRDSIRIQTAGAAFRRNLTGKSVQVGGVTVPDGSCVMYHFGDIHLDPEVYPEPLRWDPGRYLPDRAEDKAVPHGFIGWGVGRHPCPGQRFAKLESNLITAFFLAYFDFEYSDKDGNTEGVKPPPMNLNALSAHKPNVPTYLKYKRRQEAQVVA